MVQAAWLPEPTANVAPTAVTGDEATSARVAEFLRNGFIGPVKLYEPDEAIAMLREIRIKNQNKAKALYDNDVNYDRHFDIPLLAKHIMHPEIVRCVQGILGPDILLWRTEFFPKFPGSAGTEWHQVTDYSYASGHPQIVGTEEDWNALIDITVWTSFTRATRQNGCLRFVSGSHKKWYFDEHKTARTGRKAGYDVNDPGTAFFGYEFSDFLIDHDWQPDPADVAEVETEPGEAVIFTANCVHGSLPNSTARETRYAISARYVPAHVRVYPDQTEYVAHGAHFDLANYGCVLAAGKNEYSHNRIRLTDNHGVPFAGEEP
jgi:non-heme Fe2+,alpha-ketoglutarate-dependent halogenase